MLCATLHCRKTSQLCIIIDQTRHLCLRAIGTACRTASRRHPHTSEVTTGRHFVCFACALMQTLFSLFVLYSLVYSCLYLLPVCVFVCVLREAHGVYGSPSLRNHNPTVGPTHSLGFHSSCLAKLMATSIMTSPQHSVIGLQTPRLSANRTLLR